MGKYFYKVIHKNRKTKELKSAVITGKPAVVYKQKVWTYPTIKKSKLFVFQTLHAAVSFRECDEDEKIFRCLVKKPRKIRNIMSYTSSIADFREFWNCYAKEKKCFGSNIPPCQTFVVDAVKLIDEACGYYE
jgi:hypothetical protein